MKRKQTLVATNLPGIICPIGMILGVFLTPILQNLFQEKMPLKTPCPERAKMPYCQIKSELLHFNCADIIGVLGTKITGMMGLDFTNGYFFLLGLFQGNNLGFG